MKKVVVTVTNDLVTDQRVMRTIGVLQEMGMQPTFVGRLLPNSLEFKKDYSHKRFKLAFTRGFLFYANYNLRLFFYLLRHPFDVYLANDLDTLLPNFLVSKLRGKPLIYDSHEYFTGVPEIQNRAVVKWVWTRLERFVFPKLKHVVTVNQSIARLYEQAYGMRIKVVRNISDANLPSPISSRKALGLPPDDFLLINQGAGINVDRGMEEALLALNFLPEKVKLLIVGDGDAVAGLKTMAEAEGLTSRVIFVPKQPYFALLQYTLNANCGLSLDKPLSPNYQYSLPNKLFDYIKCGLPVVTSTVVEVKKVVEQYQIGELIESHKPEHIAQSVEKVLAKEQFYYKTNLQKAAKENNWETEQLVWKTMFDSLS